MAALLAFGLLGAAALAMASPLVDVEKTSLSLDRRPELLDEGHITVHLARVVRNTYIGPPLCLCPDRAADPPRL